MIEYNSDIQVFYSTKINDDNFFSGFGTIKTNIGDRFSKLSIVEPKQTHSDIIKCLDNLNDQVNADGIITIKNNMVLTVQTADCVPIIYVDKKKKIIGISHQGWKGSLLRLPQKMIQKFYDLKSNIYDLNVVIGPSIGVCCYKIWGDRKTQFENEFSKYVDRIIDNRPDADYLNLLRLNYEILIESGIKKENIDYLPFCTKCNSDKFYSNSRNDMASEMVNYIYMK